MNMTGTPPTDDDTTRKSKPIDAADLLDENGRVDISKVKSRAKTTNNESTSVGDDLCHDMRVAASRDDVEEVGDFADEFRAAEDTIRYHVRGDCSCSPTIDPVTEIITTTVTPAVCDDLRTVAADADQLRSITPLVEEFGLARSTVNRHVSGGCNCDPDTAPLAFNGSEWTVAAADDETGGDA